MVPNVKCMLFVLGNVFGVTNFNDFLLGRNDSDEFNGFESVNLESSNILIIQESILYSLYVSVLRANSERLNRFSSLLCILPLILDNFILSC